MDPLSTMQKTLSRMGTMIGGQTSAPSYKKTKKGSGALKPMFAVVVVGLVIYGAYRTDFVQSQLAALSAADVGSDSAPKSSQDSSSAEAHPNTPMTEPEAVPADVRAFGGESASNQFAAKKNLREPSSKKFVAAKKHTGNAKHKAKHKHKLSRKKKSSHKAQKHAHAQAKRGKSAKFAKAKHKKPHRRA